MKRILGLDLGTNSIGWSLIEQDFENKTGKILGIGSRIIPMSQEILGDFGKGSSVSQTAERTRYRSIRRLRERNLLRRERLHRVLNVLGFLPEHYAADIDFEKRFGKFREGTETKLPWKKEENEKFSFLFQSSFNEMLADFKAAGQDIKIPYDWTIYYLRKKALTQKITKEELVWLILNFNQKRGYYQLRGEEEENTTDKKEFVALLKITKVEKGEVDKKNDKKIWYSITFENGWVHSFPFTSEPNWLNTEREFLVTEEYDENGCIKIVKDRKNDTEGREKRSISTLPSFEEIDLMSKKDQDKIYKKIKARTEITIDKSGKTVGSYIYETLLQNPTQKIRGKLVRTIERKFYKEELKAILEKQIALQPELFTSELYNDCVRELYKSNEIHQLQLSKRDFVHLFLDDIIFYQRPLRSQKSSIGNCSLEYKQYKRKDEKGKGLEVKEYLKAIPKSNPYYQEFRVWQWLYNLKIYTKTDDTDVTATFLKSVVDLENLFEFLMNKKEVNHTDILNYLIEPMIKEKYPDAKPKSLKEKITAETIKYRWNYVFDDSKDKEDEKSKKYPMNETGYEIGRRLEKVENVPVGFLSREIEQQLWHIIYSVNDKNEFEKALKSFAIKHKLDETSFVGNFKNFKPFKSEYGSFSEKAIKKLLPLIRIGKYWNWGNIDIKTQVRITNLQTAEVDESIRERVREKVNKEKLDKNEDYQGLPLWLAQYVVYNRHSEAADIGKWNSADDLKTYLNEFKQHSLRNPIVEQVITETLRVVKDIWTKYGSGAKDFFDEIHIELGREMKNTAEDRKKMTTQITDNENTNQRIKLLLMELKNDANVEDVRPYSPMQQDILKIYEDGALSKFSEQELKNEAFENAGKDEAKNVYEISRKAQPTKNELIRYKLWLEQKYRSPYTGEIIPLGKLFTSAYEIEHIIPQSRYFDDSLSNKVICESAVNKLKDNKLGLEFIKKHYGQKVPIDGNIEVAIFTEAGYKEFVDDHYSKNKSKRNKLLLEEIPDKMIARQMNDTRYISKFISQVLSNIVRADKDDDGVNSTNIVPGNGKITTQLKQDWGLNDVWNELVLPRFERMNKLTTSEVFTAKNKEGHTIPAIPFELSKGFQKKRIDHRHHAMDALIIACATRDHVNLLNNQSAKSDNSRFDLQHKLRNTEKWKDKEGKERDKFTEFKKPWQNFTVDTKNELEKIVVSFKQNLRVINKATNTYEKFENGKKTEKKQEGVNWAIRKPMHKDTVSGKVELKRIKVPKGKILTATRKSINTSFNKDTIKSITDTGIQKILRNYLAYTIRKKKNEINADVTIGEKDKKKLLEALVKNPAEIAFTPEGIEDMNKNISQYNNGKPHQPIYKARIFELGSKFPLGQSGNKKDKYVEAAKGTNLFFAIYEKDGNRSFATVPLNEVIERQKQGLSSVPETNEKGDVLLFYLSPNDLVYVPTEEELANDAKIDFSSLTKEQKKRIYKMVSSTGSECHFIHANISSLVKSYDAKSKVGELGSLNKLETTMTVDVIRIKEKCFKLYVDRLGNISPVKKKPMNEITSGQSIVSEPEIAYKTKKWTVKKFDSFDAMENDQLEYFASLTPEELLKNLKKLSMSAFGFKEEGALNKPDREIKFD